MNMTYDIQDQELWVQTPWRLCCGKLLQELCLHAAGLISGGFCGLLGSQLLSSTMPAARRCAPGKESGIMKQAY